MKRVLDCLLQSKGELILFDNCFKQIIVKNTCNSLTPFKSISIENKQLFLLCLYGTNEYITDIYPNFSNINNTCTTSK